MIEIATGGRFFCRKDSVKKKVFSSREDNFTVVTSVKAVNCVDSTL